LALIGGDSKIQKKHANLARSACPSRSSPTGFWKKIFLFSATLQKEYFFAKNLDCLRSSSLAKKASFFSFFVSSVVLSKKFNTAVAMT